MIQALFLSLYVALKLETKFSLSIQIWLIEDCLERESAIDTTCKRYVLVIVVSHSLIAMSVYNPGASPQIIERQGLR